MTVVRYPRAPLRVVPEIVELPRRPEATTVARGTDTGPSTPTCRCGQELEASWSFCPACSRSTAPPAPPPPSRSELLDAEMRRLDAARPGPPPPNPEQLCIAAAVKAGKKALVELGDLEPAHFADAGLGHVLEGLRHLAASGGRWDAGWAATWAARVAEARATPPSGPRMGKAVYPTPSELDLERWARHLTPAEAVQVARDLSVQVKAVGSARRAELEERQRDWEAAAMAKAPTGSHPCPHCQSWQLVVEDIDGFRQRERCLRCRNSWPARPIEQLEEAGE